MSWTPTDVEAFTELYQQYRHVAVNVARTWVGDAAEDVAQEVFVLLWQRPGVLMTAESPAGFIGFLAKMAAWRYIRDSLRPVAEHEKPLDPIDLERLDQPSMLYPRMTTPFNETLARQLRRRIMAAFLALPPRVREIARARFIDESSVPEIVSERQLSERTVTSAIRRAEAKLRPALAPFYSPTGVRVRWYPAGLPRSRGAVGTYGPRRAALTADERAQLQALLPSFTAGERQIAQRYWLEDRPTHEIASETGRSAGAVGSLASRALRRLRGRQGVDYASGSSV